MASNLLGILSVMNESSSWSIGMDIIVIYCGLLRLSYNHSAPIMSVTNKSVQI